MQRVGYVGLGIMGGPMAANLLKAGFDVTVWNRTQSKAQPLLEQGATWADSPAEVAKQVEAVCVNVTATADVEHVLFGSDGIAKAAGGEGGRGDGSLVVIDHSTINPASTRDFAKRLAERGIAMLDAPVSGGDTGAKAGTLSIMVGGEQEAFQRCVPVLEAMGRTITHVGDHGDGQACKACNQVMVSLTLLGVCEAMALGAKEGLDLNKMIDVTSGGAAGSWQLENLGPRLARHDTAPGFMIDLINKDLNIVIDEAQRLGLPLMGTSVVADLFKAASANGFGREGTQALGRLIERLGAFSYKNG